jgi:ABC-type glycerol-3-phosphate transport system substrate-binding protein
MRTEFRLRGPRPARRAAAAAGRLPAVAQRLPAAASFPAAALCAALVLAGAAACAGGGSASTAASGSASPLPSVTGPVTITFEEAMSSGTLKTTLQTLVTQFESKYPDITVKLAPESDYGTLLTKEKAEVAAHNAPTLGQAYESWAEEFAASGVIVPISTLAGTSAPAQLSTFYTGVQKDLYLPDGKLWEWPFNKSLQVLFWNQNLLTADGLTVPTTWSQFQTALTTGSKGGVVGTTIDPGGASGVTSGEEWLEELAASNGASLYASDGTPQFTSAGAVAALQYLVGLKHAGALATGSNYPGETALGAKKGLVDLSSSAGYYYETQAVGGKFTMTTSGFPAGSSGAADMMAGTNLVVFSSATAQQKAAAWDFMQYLTTPAVQAQWAVGTGYLPVTAQALTQPSMTSYLAQNAWVDQVLPSLNSAIFDPPYTWVTNCGTFLSNALQAGLSGTSAASAMQTAQSACEQAKAADS